MEGEGKEDDETDGACMSFNFQLECRIARSVFLPKEMVVIVDWVGQYGHCAGHDPWTIFHSVYQLGPF